jgi:hypothetical protein
MKIQTRNRQETAEKVANERRPLAANVKPQSHQRMRLDGIPCDDLAGPPDRVRLECSKFGVKDVKLIHGRLSKTAVEYQLGCRLKTDDKLTLRGCVDESWGWYPLEFSAEGTSIIQLTPGRAYDLKTGACMGWNLENAKEVVCNCACFVGRFWGVIAPVTLSSSVAGT